MAPKGHCRVHKLTLLALALGVVLTLTAAYVETHPSPAAAQASGIVQGLSASTPVLNYQGRLLDPATGNPMSNGAYRMVFSLYDAATGGSPLWTEIKNVAVSGGLFNTLLGDTTVLNLSIFDGRALWLGVTVGADPESSPRMPIAYAPYALYASHASNADTLGGQPSGAFAPTTHNHNAADVTAGTLSTARYSAYADLLDETRVGTAGDQVAAGNHVHDSRYYTQADANKAFVNDDANEVGNPDIPAGALSPDRIAGTAWTASNDGSASGLDADLLDGNHSSAFAAASHSHDAAAITAGTLSTNRYSAYADLAAEGKLGEAAGQVASGNHTHDTRYFTESESDARFVKKTGDAMSGALTVPRVAYTAPRTQYFVVGGEGFVPGSNVAYVNTYGNGGANIVSGTGALVASVHLPQGAVVTGFKVFFYDASASNMSVTLQAEWMNSGYFNMAQVSSAGVSGYGSNSTTSIGGNPVDNTTYSYCIYAYCTAWDGSNLRIKGALITYTISEAP